MSNRSINPWKLIGTLTGLFLLFDNFNGGPLHFSLILHELGHWLFAVLLTLKPARIDFYFYNGSGICTHEPTLFFFSWIISIMGAGFQNILGALIMGIAPRHRSGRFFRRVGLAIYLGGFLDISFAELRYGSMFYGDFAEQSLPKLLMLGYLNYWLVSRVILKKKRKRTSRLARFGEAFMVQAGYRK